MAIFDLGTIDQSTTEVPEQNQQQQTTDPTVINQSETNTVDETKKPEQQKTIVLDGPLSHIYTQALNMVYANEAVNMITHMMMEQEEEDKNPYGKDVYVYCCDGDNLTSDELVNASSKLRIALDKKKYNKVLLSVECHGIVNNRVGLLHDFSVSLGIPVSYTKSGSMSNIKTAIESMKTCQ